jgi:hypothetical protein
MFLDLLKKTFCRKKTPDKPKEKRKRGRHSRSRRQIQSEVKDVLMSLKTNAEHLCDYPDNTSLYKCWISRWPGRKAIKILLSEHGISCDRKKPKPKVNGEYRDKILYVVKKRDK